MATLECEIRNLNGGIHTVTISRAAKVWKLWNVIENVMDIPEYEQQLVCGSVQLRSEMALSELLPTRDSNRLQIMLVRTSTPECFGIDSAKQIWNAFLSFSDDEGGTIPIGRVNALMQYAGMRRSAVQFNARESAHRKLTFPDVLSSMAEWKESVEPSPRSNNDLEDLEHQLQLLDPDNTGFVSRRDLMRTIRANSQDDDSDSEAEEDSEADDDDDDVLDYNGDELVEWRGELQAILAETPDDFLW
eukprot:TRINITY_DN7360_c0_g1_i1.p1 TRINITY_DN7360_c0_g1~~TRINITY_DN7360_c0_g1_i1.p1  ORF type:complete len:265 (-),score=61.72 TRINITY_DN7360_c0_g1_i1:134-871(-)